MENVTPPQNYYIKYNYKDTSSKQNIELNLQEQMCLVFGDLPER